MNRRFSLFGFATLWLGVVIPAAAQNADELTIIDSVVVEGADRVGVPGIETNEAQVVTKIQRVV